jgi:hypothetical protein
MRTTTTINWALEKITSPDGRRLGTMHAGHRGSWSFRIDTPVAGKPKLLARHVDGRAVTQPHVSLRAAKNAALSLLHPYEQMGWGATNGDPIRYRAQWDNLVFVLFANPEGDQWFQWRDTASDERSDAVPVSGIRETRQLAAAVLLDRFPEETPTEAPPAAVEPRDALRAALDAAGITFTEDQLKLAATALVVQRARP